MKKSTTRFYSALLVCAMLAGLLPANAAAGEEPFAAQAGAAAAPGKGFRQPDAGKAQAEAAAEADREVIEIDSADGLAAAIAGQQAGQTWKLAPGVYELTQAHLDLYAHWDAPGQGGWYFPLYADGLTLLGQGEVVVTTEVQSQNGVWATQDFVSVWGDGITIDGVDFGSKSEPNKAIEVMGKDFTLKNCTLLPVVHPDGENGEVFSGSIYFNPANEQADLGRCTLENVYLHAYISASAARAGVIDVRGVTMDARNNIWRVWGTGYGPGLVGSVYGQVEQVRYLVDEHAVLSDILDAGSAYAADTKPGTTIEFSAGTYRLNAPVTIGQDVALVGAGSDRTVFQAAAEPTVLIQVAGGDVDFSLSGIHVKGVEHNSHNNTSAVQVGSNGSPSTGNIEITACRFSGFTKNSVTIKGGKARIAGNVIDCQPYPGAAGNGIQIDMGAQAVITGNTVNGYVSQTENWSACGMLVLRGGQITTVRDNTVTGCQTGIVKETYYDAEGDQTYLDPQAARNNVFVGCVRDVDFEFDLAAEIAAYTGGVIVLPCDVTLADRLTIDKDVVLDGSGFAIYGPGIDVTAGALTLRDVTLEGQESGGAAVLSINGADGGVTASLSGVAVAGPADAPAIEITGGADVGMTGCVIRQAGRGVHIDRSGDGEAYAVTVSMRDTEITAQTDAVLVVDRPDAGCGVSVEIAGGSYTGAIRVENKAEASAVVITGGRFSADPTEYVASGYRVSVSGGMYVVSANTPGADTPGGTPGVPVPPAQPEPSEPETSGGNTTVSTQVQPTVSGDTSRAEVDAGVLDKAVDSVLEAAAENNTAPVVEIVVDSGETAHVEVQLPVSSLDTLGRHESAALTVASGVATVTLDSAAITAVTSQARGQKVVLAVSPVAAEALNEKQQAAAGGAPVFDLHLKSDDTAIAHFGAGQATVSLPHALPDGQTADGVAVYHLDEQGNTTLRGTSYDADAQRVTFTTPHFSMYMVGYEAARPAGSPFADVSESDYFYDAVQWAVQQGVALGTAADAFSPHAPCTRAQTVTFLFRAAGQ